MTAGFAIAAGFDLGKTLNKFPSAPGNVLVDMSSLVAGVSSVT